jgi:hypothetical protein
MTFLTERTGGVSLDGAPKAVREAVAAWRQAESDLRAVEREMSGSSRTPAEARTMLERAAKAEDERLLAEALKAGEPDPGTPNLDALNERLANLERQYGARKLLAAEALVAANRVIEANAETWRTTELKIAAKQRERVRELVAELSSAVTELGRAEGVVQRLERDALELPPEQRTRTGSSAAWGSHRPTRDGRLSPSVVLGLVAQLAELPDLPEPPRFIGRLNTDNAREAIPAF